ncbi:hypothetical protein C8F01DRAFT_1098114, partial [Mycena amicta]
MHSGSSWPSSEDTNLDSQQAKRMLSAMSMRWGNHVMELLSDILGSLGLWPELCASRRWPHGIVVLPGGIILVSQSATTGGGAGLSRLVREWAGVTEEVRESVCVCGVGHRLVDRLNPSLRVPPDINNPCFRVKSFVVFSAPSPDTRSRCIRRPGLPRSRHVRHFACLFLLGCLVIVLGR